MSFFEMMQLCSIVTAIEKRETDTMSDGNFNRALLPPTPYASGLKAGKAQERVRAGEAFKAWLTDYQPALSEDEVERQCRVFMSKMKG